jgi:hypothetical protein
MVHAPILKSLLPFLSRSRTGNPKSVYPIPAGQRFQLSPAGKDPAKLPANFEGVGAIAAGGGVGHHRTRRQETVIFFIGLQDHGCIDVPNSGNISPEAVHDGDRPVCRDRGRTVMDCPGNGALPDHSPTGDRGSRDTRLLQRVCGRPHPFPPDIPVLFRFLFPCFRVLFRLYPGK